MRMTLFNDLVFSRILGSHLFFIFFGIPRRHTRIAHYLWESACGILSGYKNDGDEEAADLLLF